MSGDVNWLDKFLDWGWGVFLAASGAVLALVHRIYKQDARLEALEVARKANTDRLERIEQKLDEHEDLVIEKLDKMRDLIDRNHNAIVTQLLERVPRQ